nr:cytochrome c [Chloroflexota bacterium]
REDGGYGAVGSNLSTDGDWQIEAVVRRRGREDARTGFRAELASAETAGQPPTLDALVPAIGLSPQRVTAIGLMALGLALFFWISRSRRVDRRERLMIYSTSIAVAVIGVVLYSRAIAAPVAPPDIRSLRSPFPPDAASLAQGKGIYDQLCVACHGPSGRGDGPLGRTLRPRPADFRVHLAAGHTDGELFNWVTNGVPETAMPAYGEQLSETDRWHVINYIRGFIPQDQ